MSFESSPRRSKRNLCLRRIGKPGLAIGEGLKFVYTLRKQPLIPYVLFKYVARGFHIMIQDLLNSLFRAESLYSGGRLAEPSKSPYLLFSQANHRILNLVQIDSPEANIAYLLDL